MLFASLLCYLNSVCFIEQHGVRAIRQRVQMRACMSTESTENTLDAEDFSQCRAYEQNPVCFIAIAYIYGIF